MKSVLTSDHEHFAGHHSFSGRKCSVFHALNDVFEMAPDDELDAESQEDAQFLAIISGGIHVNETGHLEMLEL